MHTTVHESNLNDGGYGGEVMGLLAQEAAVARG
jgi:hypothetical protein